MSLSRNLKSRAISVRRLDLVPNVVFGEDMAFYLNVGAVVLYI